MGAESITPTTLIEADLPCAACGYNLRTQPRIGRCPECGVAVSETFAYIDWSRRWRVGWLTYGALMLAIAGKLLCTSNFDGGVRIEPGMPPLWGESDLLFVIGGALLPVGVGALAVARGTTARRDDAARVCVAAACLLFAVAWISRFQPHVDAGWWNARIDRPRWLSLEVAAVWDALSLVLLAAAGRFLRPFFADLRLSGWQWRCRWGLRLVAAAPLFDLVCRGCRAAVRHYPYWDAGRWRYDFGYVDLWIASVAGWLHFGLWLGVAFVALREFRRAAQWNSAPHTAIEAA